MPTLLQSSKEGTSKVNPLLKRVIIGALLVASNVASYVVGNENISASEIVNIIVRSLSQCVIGG